MDEMEITILPDGTIKTSTNKVSMPNHSSAENFLREVQRMTGGKTTRTRKSNSTHSHALSVDEKLHQ